MATPSRHASDLLTSVLGLVGAAGPATSPGDDTTDLEGSEFVGTWAVMDTHGEPFEITLSAAATAEADRDGEGMSGTWDEDGPSALIKWNTGWTTKITRTGDAYIKTAYDQTATAPTNTSPAE